MKLRFKVNQAECFRRGVDCRTSIHTLEINPADLPQEQRDLIADRLEGIDVCELEIQFKKEVHKRYVDGEFVLLEAKTPDFEALIDAAKENAKHIEELKSVPF